MDHVFYVHEIAIISKTFQGIVEVTSRKIEERRDTDKGHTLGPAVTKRIPFFFLTLDLPPMPLFTDEFDKNIIPQIPLGTLLSKFDGITVQVNMNYYLYLIHMYVLILMRYFSSWVITNGRIRKMNCGHIASFNCHHF
jgi:U4/U6.U5 tri-snRNP-associated protein 2